MATYQDFKKACDYAVKKLGTDGIKNMSWFGKWNLKSVSNAPSEEKKAA